MKGKTETAIEYYALVFDSGEKKLFSSDGVRERIRKARGAASIGTLTDSQILALFDDIERNHWGWNFSTGGFNIGFISSQQIPVGSSGYISLQLLLGRKLDKRSRLHEMLNKSVRIADCIRAVCGVKDESAQPIKPASADYPQQVQALTGVAVPDTVEGHQEDIEGSDGSVPNVNVVNQLTKEDVAEAVRVGVRDGLLDTDALSQKSRVNEIRKRQEDMLLEQGRKPIEVARIHNRDAGEKKIRTESLRIARNQREEKQK